MDKPWIDGLPAPNLEEDDATSFWLDGLPFAGIENPPMPWTWIPPIGPILAQ